MLRSNVFPIAFALSIVALLQGCMATAPAVTTTASATGTMYCHEEKLTTVNAGHQCNWSTNLRDVCDGSVVPSAISRDKIQGQPVRTRRCNTGLWVVEVAPRA